MALGKICRDLGLAALLVAAALAGATLGGAINKPIFRPVRFWSSIRLRFTWES